MKRWIIYTLVLLILIIWALTPKEEKKTIEETYYSWQSPSTEQIGKIARTLIKNNISGCGEFHLREHKEFTGEYLLGCSRDGENWSYYLIWPNSEKIMGPLANPVINAREESEFIEPPYKSI